jgi:hypothetical protein
MGGIQRLTVREKDLRCGIVQKFGRHLWFNIMSIRNSMNHQKVIFFD